MFLSSQGSFSTKGGGNWKATEYLSAGDLLPLIFCAARTEIESLRNILTARRNLAVWSFSSWKKTFRKVCFLLLRTRRYYIPGEPGKRPTEEPQGIVWVWFCFLSMSCKGYIRAPLVPSREEGFPFSLLTSASAISVSGSGNPVRGSVPRMIYLACLMSVGVAFEDFWPQY